MPWDQLDIYMYNHGCHIMPVMGDDFCFVNAINLVLYCDYNEVVMQDSLASNILGCLVANVHYHNSSYRKHLKGHQGLLQIWKLWSQCT